MDTTNKDMYTCLTDIGLPNGWEKEIQLDNFNRSLKIVEYTSNETEKRTDNSLEKISFLDVGCGTGDFLKFLKDNKIKNDYLGIDIYEPSIEKAKERFPEEEKRFKLDNILNWTVSDKTRYKFDYIIASGSLSTYTENNYNFLNQMLTKIWEHTSKGVYFNLMANNDGSEGREQEWLFHYSVEKVKKICEDIVGKEGVIKIDSIEHKIQEQSPEKPDYKHVHFYLIKNI